MHGLLSRCTCADCMPMRLSRHVCVCMHVYVALGVNPQSLLSYSQHAQSRPVSQSKLSAFFDAPQKLSPPPSYHTPHTAHTAAAGERGQEEKEGWNMSVGLDWRLLN